MEEKLYLNILFVFLLHTIPKKGLVPETSWTKWFGELMQLSLDRQKDTERN